MNFVRRYVVGVMLFLAATTQMMGQGNTASLNELQAEMYRLFATEDSLDFRDVVIQLKVESERVGNEEMFYLAWTYQALYQAIHNRLSKAMETVRLIKSYAEDHDSKYGQYAAIHAMGAVYQQMHDFDKAEETYKKAIDYMHENILGVSAASNYIELSLLSKNTRRDIDQALAYAVLAHDEPNLTAYQRMRVLTMLCVRARKMSLTRNGLISITRRGSKPCRGLPLTEPTSLSTCSITT